MAAATTTAPTVTGWYVDKDYAGRESLVFEYLCSCGNSGKLVDPPPIRRPRRRFEYRGRSFSSPGSIDYVITCDDCGGMTETYG